MSSNLKKEKKNQYELAAESSRSEEDVKGREQLQGSNGSFKKSNTKYYVGGGFFAFVLSVCTASVYYKSEPSLQFSQYQFQVYCPIHVKDNIIWPNVSQALNAKPQFIDPGTPDLRVLSQQTSSQTNEVVDQYIIDTYLGAPNQTKPNEYLMYYCSWVVSWENRFNCSTQLPVFKCTSPGPIFHVKKGTPIEVAWVYNIQKKNESASFSKDFGTSLNYSCYNQYDKYNGSNCTSHRKKYIYENNTYEGPTQKLDPTTSSHDNRISFTNIPNTVHIHGLEVRPTFDGNPQSWLSSNGTVGVGFMSLLDQNYYNLFNKAISTNLKIDPSIGHTYVKVNRYQNFQPPGNLWYHDHSMRATQANVAFGLAGDYIIYDPQVDKQLPTGKYEIFIVADGRYSLPDSDKNDHKNKQSSHSEYGIRINPVDVPFKTLDYQKNPDQKPIFQRNQTYRIRILNAQFDSVFTNISIRADCPYILESLQNPNSKGSVNVTGCNNLSFMVIGSDSSIFKKPVQSQTLTLASAERFQILIVFDGNNAGGNNLKENIIKDKNQTTIYVTLVNPDQTIVIKKAFILNSLTQNKPNNINKLPSQFTQITGVDFYDLSTEIKNDQLCSSRANPKKNTTTCISVKRMRPFFLASGAFFFNGHFSFTDNGSSDDPQIGTTQDWYLINTASAGFHPIHIHLINYQVISQATLKSISYPFNKTTNKSCSLYEIDYWNQANFINKTQFLSNSTNMSEARRQMCKAIKNLNITKSDSNFSTQSLLFQQNHTNSVTHVSGFDIQPKIQSSDQSGFYTEDIDNTCEDSITGNYKYICKEFSNEKIPLWYRNWKQVVLIPNFVVMKVRIRWTKTDYNPNDSQVPGQQMYPYFSVPEDQLIEFPGYVYHCHFLPHEDNELMRSFMMKPSFQFQNGSHIRNKTLEACVSNKQTISKKVDWNGRYNCINEIMNGTFKGNDQNIKQN